MKIFFYKSLLVSVIFIVVYKITIGSMIKEIENKIINYFSKENIEFMKNEIKDEITKSLSKEKIINKDDAILLNKFFNKIKDDLK